MFLSRYIRIDCYGGKCFTTFFAYSNILSIDGIKIKWSFPAPTSGFSIPAWPYWYDLWLTCYWTAKINLFPIHLKNTYFCLYLFLIFILILFSECARWTSGKIRSTMEWRWNFLATVRYWWGLEILKISRPSLWNLARSRFDNSLLELCAYAYSIDCHRSIQQS